MRVTLLNTFDIYGGAALATYRIHKGLAAIGVNSSLLVQRKGAEDASVFAPKPGLNRAACRLRPYLDALVNKLYPKRDRVLFSSALLPDGLRSRVSRTNPDIVHLFWMNAGFMKIETLAELGTPIVWTLHDMWPFTGGCHYDRECGRFRQSCGRCPVLHSNADCDLSRYVLTRKQKSWGGLPITVVATSRWLADMARASSIFGNKRVEVIPNAIDTDTYSPIVKKTARAVWGLPQDKKLILFSAFSATSDKRKGNQFLCSAIENMVRSGRDSNTELVILGASGPESSVKFGMKVHYMGCSHDEKSQVLLYSAADVTVAPSMQENLSNTVMESLACGTPVVAFNVGGMPDLIDHQKSGYLATPFDVKDLAAGIVWVLNDKARYISLSKSARHTVCERYALKTVANRYLELYQSLITKSRDLSK